MSVFSIDNFRSSFAGLGTASPHLFRFELKNLPKLFTSSPALIKALGNINNSHLTMRVKSANLPDMNFMTMPHSYYGPQIKYPHDNLVSDLTVEIIASGNMVEREFISAWQNYIIDYGTRDNNASFNVAYFEDYVADIDIVLYDKLEREIYRVTYQEAYPTNMSQVEVDWGQVNTVLTFRVTFSFSYWSPRIGLVTADTSSTGYPPSTSFWDVLMGSLQGAKTVNDYLNTSFPSESNAAAAQLNSGINSIGNGNTLNGLELIKAGYNNSLTAAQTLSSMLNSSSASASSSSASSVQEGLAARNVSSGAATSPSNPNGGGDASKAP